MPRRRIAPAAIATTVTGLVPMIVVARTRRRMALPPGIRAFVAPLLMSRGWFLVAQGVRLVYYKQATPLGDAPPERLVTDGVFARRRNPMTVGVLVVLAGWFVSSGRPALLLWCGLVFAVSRHAIVHVEEPSLREVFGPLYQTYLDRTPRWGWSYG